MKHSIYFCMLSFAALVVGCIPLSLQPLYTEDTKIFEPALVGAWVAADGETPATEGWFFASEDGATYKLVIRENGKANPMRAQLVKIGESVFLDMFPEEVELGDADQPGHQLGDYYRMQLLPLHTFVRIELEGDKLRISPAYYKALEKLMSDGLGDIAHQPMPDDSDWFFFTATPEALQKWVIQHEKTLFDDEDSGPVELKRRVTKAPALE